jgi:hypothetical protein
MLKLRVDHPAFPDLDAVVSESVVLPPPTLPFRPKVLYENALHIQTEDQ